MSRPQIGGFATTYFSWRWVFAGGVLVVLGILLLARRVQDTPPEARGRFDVAGAVLAAAGVGLAVLGSCAPPGGLGGAETGRTIPARSVPTVWFVLAGLLVTWVLFERESKLPRSPCSPRRFFPNATPRRVVRHGLLAMFAGIAI